MSILPSFHFVQPRGQWTAICDDPACEFVLGTRTVPVVPDQRDGQWSWGKNVQFRSSLDQLGRPWWNDSGQSVWRELLQSGVPVLVRRATPSNDANTTISIGAMIGVFRITKLQILEYEMTFDVVERLAHAS